MRQLLLFLALLVSSADGVRAQDERTFADQLLDAVESDEMRLVDLIRANRLDVKPAFLELSNRYIDAKLSGEGKTANRLIRVASTICKSFHEQFEERYCSVRAAHLQSLSDDQLAMKFRADSLLAAGVAIRAGATREQAYELFLEAEQLFDELNDEAGLAEVTGQKGYINWWLDRDQYLVLNTEALERRRAIDDRQLIGNSLNDVGLYHRAISRDYEKALEAYLEGEQIRWEIGDSSALSRMLPNIGISFEGVGEFMKAQDYYLVAADLYHALGDNSRFVTQRSNAALVLTDYLGRHSEAKVIFLGLREELREIDDQRAWAIILNNLGIVNRRMGDYEGAILNYMEVVEVSEQEGYTDLMAMALNNIGVVHQWVNRPERSIPVLQRAIEQFRADSTTTGTVDALINLGNAHFELGAYSISDSVFTEALVEAGRLSDQVAKTMSLTGIGNARLRGQGPDQATPVFEEALEIANVLNIPELAMGILFGLGDAAEQADKPEQAFQYYDEGFRQIESARGLLRAEEDKAGFIAQARYLYEDVIDFLSRQAASTEDTKWSVAAFNFAERSKARGFLDQLAEAIAGVMEGIDPELLSNQQILSDNLAYFRSELANSDPATEREKIDELKELIREQEIEFDLLERELRETNPRYASLKYPDPINLEGVQAGLLRDGEVLLQYAVGDSSSTLWVVGKDSFKSHLLPPRSELEQQVDLLRFELTNPSQSTVESFGTAASRLYQVLVEPAAEQLTAAQSIVIIPDDALHYVPFEVLVSSITDGAESFSELPYLLHDAPVRYAQSASVLYELQKSSGSEPELTHDFLAVGDPLFDGRATENPLRSGLLPLPFSGQEVRSIASLFDSDRADVLLQADATETQIRSALENGSYRFVHIATHGLINDDRPDYSALAFSADDSENDGLLQAAEIFNMNVNAEMVVLSACETGLGQLIRGEGMVGLTRAFMYAGTPAVAVSLWKVADESTSKLMSHFYSELQSGSTSKSIALQRAKLRLVAQEDLSHPFHWAPFVLVGDRN